MHRLRELRLTDRITQYVARQQAAMVSLLEALVRVPTENPPGTHCHEAVTLLADAMRDAGLEPELLPVVTPDTELPRWCVEAFHGAGERTLYFHGHYDVVPADERGQFEPRRRGDTVFGRGTSDMKSGLVSMVFAIKALDALGVPLAGRIGLVCVPDEETGGRFGSAYLTREGRLGRNGVGMLLAEPTSGVVWNANRGAYSLRVRVAGRAAHVGLQYQGVNAFERAVPIVQDLIELRREVAGRLTSFRLQPDSARGSILLIGGRVEAGSNFNVVPATCTFTVDRRTNPEESFEDEKRVLLDVFDRARQQGIDCEVEVLQEGQPSATPESDPLAVALADAISIVRGSPPAFEICPGLLELRFYAAQQVPALAYGPGVLSVSHGPKEFVRVQDMLDCAVVYALTAAARLGMVR